MRRLSSSSPELQPAAEDFLEFHERHHNALEGTFARDRLHNLPRPLRSEMLLPRQTHSNPSPYCTPQWAEFNECVRDVTSQAEASSYHPEDRTAVALPEMIPERRAMDCLADLSQVPDVDPAVLAAALREAEAALQGSLEAVRSEISSPASLNLVADSAVQQQRLLSPQPRRVSYDLDKPPPCHPGDHEEAKRMRGEDPFQRPSRHTHTVDDAAPRQRSLSPRQNGMSNVHPNTWYEPSVSVSPPRASATRTKHTASPPLVNSSTQSFSAVRVPAAPHPETPTPTSSAAAKAAPDSSMQWYEVYYAWMLYYQQLYAAQTSWREQSGAHRSERRRRHHRRSRNREADEEDHLAVTAAPAEQNVAALRERQEHSFRHKNHIRPADRTDGGHFSRSPSPGGPHRRHRTRMPCEENHPCVPDEEHAATAPCGSLGVATAAVQIPLTTEVAQLRAELSRLEKNYMALSQLVAAKGMYGDAADPGPEDGRAGGRAPARHGIPVPRSPPTRLPAQHQAPKMPNGKLFGSCRQQPFREKQLHRSASSAATWKALSVRQRLSDTPSINNGWGRDPSSSQEAASQRPQWRFR